MLPVRIVNPNSFPFTGFRKIPCQSRPAGNPGSRAKDKPRYKDIITAFDIETTRLVELDQSIMYVWQWAFFRPNVEPPAVLEIVVVVGRTWEEYERFMTMLGYCLQAKERLLCWVHNLSYEFSFLRGIHRFSPDDVFAIKARKILRASWGKIDYQCSYLHSNMSLNEYLDKMGVEHKKISGFDYDKIRYPWTDLTAQELEYCIHDVVGLVEALAVEMAHDGDSLYTIPITSTGYVRRDAKRAMREAGYNYIKSQLPNFETYRKLREAFRGGDTHAARWWAGQIIYDMHSADRSSSYPDIVCNCLFPVSEFFDAGPIEFDEVMKLITVRRKAVLLRVKIWGIELRGDRFPCPYLSRDKCRNIDGGEWDNGRILQARYLETTITDIDLRIIAEEYIWKHIQCEDVCYARYGKLPASLIAETIKYYRAKTELKGVEGQEVYYLKSKNKLNAIYGMMAQDPVKRSLIYTQDGQADEYGHLDYYPEDTSKTDSELLDIHNKKAFLVYQWGCWVTAWARYRLREAMWELSKQGAEFVYCDTDSVKYLGDVDWTDYNAKRIADSKKSGAYATDPSGIVHYMGVMEQEEDMLAFRSWGAKKYVYVHLKKGEPELVCTVAGVAKSAGAEELCKAGGLTAFDMGFQFRDAGGLEAVYNDDADIMIEREGRTLHITPNVCLRPSSYTLGLAADYERLLFGYRSDTD